MRGLDLIVAPIALVSFALSMGVIFIWVPEPALAVVCALGVVLWEMLTGLRLWNFESETGIARMAFATSSPAVVFAASTALRTWRTAE